MKQAVLKRAFTLIELLIVVAIIAILAAIALPNFLEAQTRSKVSRLMGDMRTVVMAIRAYEVDHNQAMPASWFVPTLSADYNWIWTVYWDGKQDGAGRFLTTPIAYTATIPLDIFAPEFSASAGRIRNMSWNWFYVGPGKMKRGGAHLTELRIEEMSCFNSSFPDKAPHRLYGKRTYRWSIFSPGPDRVWWPTNQSVIYDPTNGTVSGGDVWYFDAVGYVGGRSGR